MKRAALAVALLAAAGPAAAESPRSGTFDFRMSQYRPSIDDQFGGNGPYTQIFGTGRGWMFRLSMARTVWDQLGAVDVGFSAGYFQDSGHGVYAAGTNQGQPSPDTTAFHVLPTTLFASYRFDWLAEHYNVPLAPYVRLGLERYNWWVTGSGGKTTKTGATNGFSFGGGLALQLDFFDPTLSREMDRDSGINRTYVYIDVEKSKVDDFGSKKSWDLSDEKTTFGAGLMFVF